MFPLPTAQEFVNSFGALERHRWIWSFYKAALRPWPDAVLRQLENLDHLVEELATAPVGRYQVVARDDHSHIYMI